MSEEFWFGGAAMVRWMRWVVWVGMVAASPATAKTLFQPWDGPARQAGGGGTKLVDHGIEIWTSGTPPRSYTVLGQASWETGHGGEFGRISGISENVRRYGGDAGIILESTSRPYNRLRSVTLVRVLVIRYD